MNAWLLAERMAVETETQLAEVRQTAADTAPSELAKRAAELRAEADRLFRLVPKQS
jgi:hypothetical protein